MKYRTCVVQWCGDAPFRRGYCNRHRLQMSRHGKIFRTRNDPNRIEIKGNFCVMLLQDNKGKFVGETIFDLEDLVRIKEHRWHITHYGYAKCTKLKIFLHNFILNLPTNKKRPIDHKNRKKLDNRKLNLRVSTPSYNQANCKGRGNTTGFKGIYKDGNKFVAQITVSYKKKHLGRFDKAEDAALAYNKAAILYFGEHARINKVYPNEIKAQETSIRI
jgi:hypothetical protein